MVVTRTEISTGTRIGIRTRTKTRTGTEIGIETVTATEIRIKTRTVIATGIVTATTIDMVSTPTRSSTTRETITTILIAQTPTSGAMKTACSPAPMMAVEDRATFLSDRISTLMERMGTVRHMGLGPFTNRPIATVS